MGITSDSNARMKGEVRQQRTSPSPLSCNSAAYLLRFLPGCCCTTAVALPNTEFTVT